MLRRASWLLVAMIVVACGLDSEPAAPVGELPTQPVLPSTDTTPLRTLANAKGMLTLGANSARVSTCLQYPACDVVVMWGFTDKESWVPSAFPDWGAALVLDAAYQPKPAHTSLHDLLK